MTDPLNKPTQPNYERDEYRAGQPARDLCRDLMAGTTAIRAGGKKYLPKWPAEKQAHYKIRASLSQVARFYQRTVQAAVGMICATPPVLNKDADPILLADAEDIDGKGTHFEVYARETIEDGINGGFTCILVDCPAIPDGLSLTHEDELALGLRPFWARIPADRIISWIVDAPDWKTLLTAYAAREMTAEQVASYAKQTITRQVVIYEPTDVTAGDFGTTCVDRYRRLRLTEAGVTWTLYERKKADAAGGERFEELGSGPMLYNWARQLPFREIPLAVIYAGVKRAAFVAEPPLHGLAELNLEHYQVSADRRYLMKLCHAPTLTISGAEEQYEAETSGERTRKPIEVGPNTVLMLQKGGKAEYIAAAPAALDSSKEEKEELVRHMATLGMSFIGKDRRGAAETATGRALDNAAENSTHATVARGAQDGFEQAFRFHAMYRDVTPPEVTVNTTYASPEVDPQIATVLWNAVAADKLDVESWLSYVRTGKLPEDLQVRLDMLRINQSEKATTDAALAADKAKTEKQRTALPEPIAA